MTRASNFLSRIWLCSARKISHTPENLPALTEPGRNDGGKAEVTIETKYIDEVLCEFPGYIAANQKKILQKITRGFPQLRVLRTIANEVYRLFDRRCCMDTASSHEKKSDTMPVNLLQSPFLLQNSTILS